MINVKDIQVQPIKASTANELVKRIHYSGKVVNNSVLHFGAFHDGRLLGVMSFGSPLDKRKVLPLVEGTAWNGMLELNRMAFSDVLPRNSESRCLAVAFRLIKKAYPHIEWILSFSDGTQCGDGTIYRASGFVLTGIKKNTSIWEAPNGEKFTDLSPRPSIMGEATRKKVETISRVTVTKGTHLAASDGSTSMTRYREAGWKPLEGFQLRYIYFINPEARKRLTVPVLPFSRIDEAGAGMYKGEKIKRAKQAMAGDHPAQRQGGTDPHAPSLKPPKKRGASK